MAALEPGTSFPTLTLLDGGGSRAPLPSGEALYVVFKTTCPTCELAWPYLERIRQTAEGGGLRIFAVSQDDPGETAAFSRRLGVRVETAYDPEPWKASDALGVTNVPTFFRVDGSGSIQETAVGFERQRMENFAQWAASLAGRPHAGLFHQGEEVPEIRPG